MGPSHITNMGTWEKLDNAGKAGRLYSSRAAEEGCNYFPPSMWKNLKTQCSEREDWIGHQQSIEPCRVKRVAALFPDDIPLSVSIFCNRASWPWITWDIPVTTVKCSLLLKWIWADVCKLQAKESWLWYTKLLSMPKAIWWTSGKTDIWSFCNLTERGWPVFKVRALHVNPDVAIYYQGDMYQVICAFEEYWPGHHTIRVVSSVTNADFQKSHCFNRWLSTHARGLPWNSS